MALSKICKRQYDIADEAGYPVLLKSAFGGGGRGIRLALDEKQLRQEFEMASAESRAAMAGTVCRKIP